MYANNNCVHQYKLPRSYQYMRNWNKGYLEWAQHHSLTRYAEAIQIHLYSEIFQEFRLAAQGKRKGKQPPDHLRKRVETYFDPLPMYHSWDSQNAWLRQIHAHNHLYMHPSVGNNNGFDDGDWVWVESMHGKVRCLCPFPGMMEFRKKPLAYRSGKGFFKRLLGMMGDK